MVEWKEMKVFLLHCWVLNSFESVVEEENLVSKMEVKKMSLLKLVYWHVEIVIVEVDMD